MSVMQIGFENEVIIEGGEIVIACVGAQCARLCRKLGRIQEGCGAVLLDFKCFVDFVHYTVSLVYCRISLAKAKLMVW
jgi:hypothetical protein